MTYLDPDVNSVVSGGGSVGGLAGVGARVVLPELLEEQHLRWSRRHQWRGSRVQEHGGGKVPEARREAPRYLVVDKQISTHLID